jgi:hypothetical protein
VLAVAFVAVRVLGTTWPHFYPTARDSLSYLKVAGHSPLNGRFYFDERPIGFPLLLWLTGRHINLAVLVQSAIYIAAWYSLCRVVYVDVSSKVVGWVAVVVLAANAIEPRIVLWNTLMLSESLSLSFAVLSVAAWWRVGVRPSTRTVWSAWLATTGWVLVRDASVFPVIVVIVPAALLFALLARQADRDIRHWLAIGAVAVTAVCGYVYVAQDVSGRNLHPLENNVAMRVLNNPQLENFYVRCGMPVNETLLLMRNHNGFDTVIRWDTEPTLARFRAWRDSRGPRCGAESMVFEAGFWWKQLHHDLPTLLNNDSELREFFDVFHVYERLPRHLPAPLGEPYTNAGFAFELLLAAAGIALAFANARRRALALVLLIGVLSAAVDVWASYISDSLDVGRHEVGPFARLHLIALLAIAVGADELWTRLRPRSHEVGREATAQDRL